MSSSSARLNGTGGQAKKQPRTRTRKRACQPDPWPLDTPLHEQYAAWIPDELQERGLRLAHARPYATNAKRCDTRVAPEAAWSYRRLQINPEHAVAVIVIDVDAPRMPWWRYWDRYLHGRSWDHVAAETDPAHRVEDEPAELPPEPSWMVVDLATGRFHVTYVLADPVHIRQDAAPKPQRYLAIVRRGLTAMWRGDPGYASPLTRNPAAPGPGCRTFWGRTAPFTLRELAEAVPADAPISVITGGSYAARGRNCALYVWGMRHTQRHGLGTAAEIEAAIHAKNVDAYVDGPEGPLPGAGERSIARSIDRRVNGDQARAGRVIDAELSAIQGARGRRSGIKRRQRVAVRDRRIRELRAQGVSRRDVAEMMDVSVSTVSRVAPQVRRRLEQNIGASHEPQFIRVSCSGEGGVSGWGGGEKRGGRGVEWGESTPQIWGNPSPGPVRPGLSHDSEALAQAEFEQKRLDALRALAGLQEEAVSRAATRFEERRVQAIDPDHLIAQAEGFATQLRSQGRHAEAEEVLDLWYGQVGRSRPDRGPGGDREPP